MAVHYGDINFGAVCLRMHVFFSSSSTVMVGVFTPVLQARLCMFVVFTLVALGCLHCDSRKI